ncbi:heavy metal-associated isoprenylated plant protein 43-like [Magnolia sinica]|uniref:heavy metal-associated isoprenylated plant protein 43-like n=1 Tax=Magnolia sinica TaxID=86752 RepID=UPI002657F6DC|nr:heavy metal-associated isoprenylated plant protein 43-like [Magnolia sinica]
MAPTSARSKLKTQEETASPFISPRSYLSLSLSLSLQKTVLKVCINCLKCKTNILKAIAKLSGINELAVDDEKGTLTVIGDVDPMCVANRLKKMGKLIEIISIGPAKPPDKPKPPEKEKTDPKPPLPSCCDKCQFAMIIYDDIDSSGSEIASIRPSYTYPFMAWKVKVYQWME